jgi:hypothetical protein
VQLLLTGVYMASIFASNHNGMLAPTTREVGGFLREQVLTSRNIRGNPLIDLVYGGGYINPHMMADPKERLHG